MNPEHTQPERTEVQGLRNIVASSSSGIGVLPSSESDRLALLASLDLGAENDHMSYAEKHEAMVVARMAELRAEHPGVTTNWIGWVNEDHDTGECVECDALRRLELEDDDES